MPRIAVFSSDGVSMPRYMSAGASGMDLYAHIASSMYVFPRHTVLVPTGIRVAIPSGYELQIRPRSGLMIRQEILLPNAPGTIDSDYRGEINVVLRNTATSIFIVYPHDRIAQVVCTRTVRARWAPARTLPPTARNQGGFGSTGR